MSRLTILIVHILFLSTCQSKAQQATITIDEFQKGIRQDEVQLLDVRTAEEFKSGHLMNALQADWNNSEEFQERVKSLSKNKPLYIYCLSGGRSSAAMNWFSQKGFHTVYNLQGGINAWNQAKLPLEDKALVTAISKHSYDSIINIHKTTLVDFGAKWCPPCKKMNPILEQLEKENFHVYRIDGSQQPKLCEDFKIDKFPVFIIYKNGKEIKRLHGVVSIEELRKELTI